MEMDFINGIGILGVLLWVTFVSWRIYRSEETEYNDETNVRQNKPSRFEYLYFERSPSKAFHFIKEIPTIERIALVVWLVLSVLAIGF